MRGNLWSPEGKVLGECHQNMQKLESLNIMEFDDASTPDYDTLLELPNRIGISLIGYLSSKLAHLLLNLIAINQGRFTCPDLSDSFPDDSHGVGVRFIEPLTKCGAFLWCQLFNRFLDFSQIRHIRTLRRAFQ